MGRSNFRIVQVKNGSMDHVRIVGTETMFSVPASTTLTKQFDQPINPLNPSMFPKLAAMAALFEQWRLTPRGRGLHLRYCPSCPTSRAGIVGAMIETDASDTALPSSIFALQQEEHSFSGALYSSHSCNLPPRQDAEKWYYTQSSLSSTLGDRTAFDGKIRIYTDSSVSGDNQLFSGYVQLDYDIEMQVFRPPTSTGFSIVNQDDVTLTTNVDTALNLSDEVNLYGLGARAAKFMWDNIVTPAAGLSEKKTYKLPQDTKTPVSHQIAYKADTPLMIDNKKFDEWVSVKGLRTVVEEFAPFECVQNSSGAWFYRMGPDENLQPYVEYKDANAEKGVTWGPPNWSRFSDAPLATYDLTVQIVSYDSAGIGTVLYTQTVNPGAAAAALALVGYITPLVPAWLVVTAKAIVNTSRVVDYVSTLIGGSTQSSGSG